MRGPIRRPNPRRPNAVRMRAELEATTIRTWDNALLAGTAQGSIVFAGSPARLPPGRRAYVVGDIHGQIDRLRALHGAIAEDLRRRPVADPLLVHLGDYIDWGPDSCGVLALLAAGPPIAGLPMVNLIGDHEQMLLDALGGDGPATTDWLHSGGRETLASWGITLKMPRDRWGEVIPAGQLNFLRGLKLHHRAGGYLFVHAGLRPGVKLSEQTRLDQQYIREPFLSTERGFGLVVVHGHTAAATPVVRANRVGIDTGAGLGGKLSAAVLEDDRIGFISV